MTAEPDALRLVPMEPTIPMLNAGWSAAREQGFDSEELELDPIWSAMVAAAGRQQGHGADVDVLAHQIAREQNHIKPGSYLETLNNARVWLSTSPAAQPAAGRDEIARLREAIEAQTIYADITISRDDAKAILAAISTPAQGSESALLREAGALFRKYEAHHRAKNTDDSLTKAEVNADIAGRIEAALSAPQAAPASELFGQGHNFIATCAECGVAFDAHLQGCSNIRPQGALASDALTDAEFESVMKAAPGEGEQS